MYIQRVVLENLKGFRSLDFSFARPDGSLAGWTALTGDNGSGKTAILKAIALALVGPDVGRALQPSLRGWIREGCSEARIEVQIHVQEQDKFTTGRRADSFWSEIELQKNGGPEVSMKAGSKRRGKKRGPLNGPWADNTGGWFAAGYGPFRRLYGASPEAQRLMSGPNRVARFATMFKEDATLLECELWLKDLNHKSLESHPREQRVLQQVCDLLNDDFLRNGLRVERVDSDGLWLRDSAGTVTTHSALVCQAADENGIFHLPPPGSEDPPFQLNQEDYLEIIRSKVDTIYLSPAFGLPEPFQTLRLHFPSVWNRASERAESGSESPLAR